MLNIRITAVYISDIRNRLLRATYLPDSLALQEGNSVLVREPMRDVEMDQQVGAS
jgi:hypothetical protein